MWRIDQVDADTEEPHNCPVWRSNNQQQQGQQPQEQQSQLDQQQQQHQVRRYHQCRKGCGQEIYFDASNKSQGGKWIPIDRQTGLPYQCPQQI